MGWLKGKTAIKLFPSIVLSNWSIWGLGVAIMYALPPLLQVPMMHIVACFDTVLVMYMTRHRKARECASEIVALTAPII